MMAKTEEQAEKDPQFVGDPKVHGLDDPRGGGFSIMQQLQEDLHEESEEEMEKGEPRKARGSQYVKWGHLDHFTGQAFGTGSRAAYFFGAFDEGDSKRLHVYAGRDIAHVDKRPDRSVDVRNFADAMDKADGIERDLLKGRAASVLVARKKRLQTEVEDSRGNVFVANLEDSPSGLLLRLREKTGMIAGTWSWPVSVLMGLDGFGRPVGDRLALDAGQGWYVEGMGKLMDEVGRSVMMEPVLASLRSRRAMYWSAPGRTYRLTKKDQENGVAVCPRCKGEMVEEPFVRGERMWRCSECGFKVPGSKAVTKKVEIEIDDGGEMEVEVTTAGMGSRRASLSSDKAS
jgi:ribosomal protein L37AE/L43A